MVVGLAAASVVVVTSGIVVVVTSGIVVVLMISIVVVLVLCSVVELKVWRADDKTDSAFVVVGLVNGTVVVVTV